MIEIVTHCWAEKFPQYATLLRYQLSSLMRYPPQVPVTVTICYTLSDALAKDAMNEFGPVLLKKGIKLAGISLGLPMLGRRSIGRNIAATETKADLIWFTDADYYFGFHALDTLWNAWQNTPEKLAGFFPRYVRQSIEHEQGEAAIARAIDVQTRHEGKGEAALPPLLYPEEYKRKMQVRPIGGTHIVSGAYARERGYLRGHKKWQKERPLDMIFTDTRDDVKFRKVMERDKIPIVAVALPNLYRIRHAASPVGRQQV